MKKPAAVIEALQSELFEFLEKQPAIITHEAPTNKRLRDETFETYDYVSSLVSDNVEQL